MRCLVILSLLLLAACQSKLETGYQPRPLGSNETVRRGYYATPFTPEANAAQDANADFESRRPKPGY
jgi:hypothetical protein